MCSVSFAPSQIGRFEFTVTKQKYVKYWGRWQLTVRRQNTTFWYPNWVRFAVLCKREVFGGDFVKHSTSPHTQSLREMEGSLRGQFAVDKFHEEPIPEFITFLEYRGRDQQRAELRHPVLQSHRNLVFCCGCCGGCWGCCCVGLCCLFAFPLNTTHGNDVVDEVRADGHRIERSVLPIEKYYFKKGNSMSRIKQKRKNTNQRALYHFPDAVFVLFVENSRWHRKVTLWTRATWFHFLAKTWNENECLRECGSVVRAWVREWEVADLLCSFWYRGRLQNSSIPQAL